MPVTRCENIFSVSLYRELGVPPPDTVILKKSVTTVILLSAASVFVQCADFPPQPGKCQSIDVMSLNYVNDESE